MQVTCKEYRIALDRASDRVRKLLESEPAADCEKIASVAICAYNECFDVMRRRQRTLDERILALSSDKIANALKD